MRCVCGELTEARLALIERQAEARLALGRAADTVGGRTGGRDALTPAAGEIAAGGGMLTAGPVRDYLLRLAAGRRLIRDMRPVRLSRLARLSLLIRRMRAAAAAVQFAQAVQDRCGGDQRRALLVGQLARQLPQFLGPVLVPRPYVAEPAVRERDQ